MNNTSSDKLTYDQIIERLKSFGLSINEFAHECTSGLICDDLVDLGECKEVHKRGGDGMGDHWESVKYFPKHEIYIKITGYHQSYSGTEFYGGYNSCCSEVKPKEKIITVYN